MNLKLKAFLFTTSSLLSGALVGYVLSGFPNWVVVTFFVAVVFALLYSLIHAGLKFDESVDNIKKRYET